ncbi:MAG: hypothetical protein ACXW02_04220, partial [Halobacteriota archaeon]
MVYVTLEYVKKEVQEVIFKFFFLNINISVFKNTVFFAIKIGILSSQARGRQNSFKGDWATLIVFSVNNEERYDKLVVQRMKA